jgi:hypothetical protein
MRKIPTVGSALRATDTRVLAAVVLVLTAVLAAAAGYRTASALAAVGSAISVALASRRVGLWRHALTPLGAFTWMFLPLTLGGMAWLYARGETGAISFAVLLVTFHSVHGGAWLMRSKVTAPLESTEPAEPFLVPGFVLLTAGLLVITAFAVLIRPTIPLLELITHPGNFLANNEWRFQYTTGTPGFAYLSQAFGNGLPFVAVFAFLAASASRSRRWAFAAVAVAGFTGLVLVLSTQRAPILWFLLLYVVGSDAKSIRVSRRRIVLYGGVVAVVMFGVLAFRTVDAEAPGATGISSALLGAIDRLFLVQNRVADFVVRLPTGGGTYLGSDLVALRPGPDIGFSGFVYNLYLPGSPVQGTAPSIFTAQLYADFSWLGVLIGGIILGLVLAFLEGLLRRTRTIQTITLVVALTLAIARLQQVDIVSAVFDFGVVAYLCCYAFLVVAGRVTRRARSSRGIGSEPDARVATGAGEPGEPS